MRSRTGLGVGQVTGEGGVMRVVIYAKLVVKLS